MAKIMLFIDGTWLYSNTPRLAESYGDPSFRVDFGKLPGVLAQAVGQKLGTTEVDVVRTYLFGSYAANYDPVDEEPVARRQDFFDILKEEYHYEVETFPVNFMGRRLRRSDRSPLDTFEPKEKCVDIALATTMLYLAAIPYAYDIAIAVIGDRDFMPMLQSVRRLGKRVAIASIKRSCAPEFSDPLDAARVKDFDIVWIDDLLHMLELKYERHQLNCESPTHKGNRAVWTTFHPRKGKKFYCDACRQENLRQKQEAQREFVRTQEEALRESPNLDECSLELNLAGKVKRMVPERGFGFIAATDGSDYFFHFTDLLPGFEFGDMHEGLEVAFEVKNQPSSDKAGAAHKIHWHD
jgi:cold shock CspA family protein